MPNFIIWTSMSIVVGIKMSSSSNASLGKISKLMNVTSMKLSRIEPFNDNFEVGWSQLMFLVNGDDAFDT